MPKKKLVTEKQMREDEQLLYKLSKKIRELRIETEMSRVAHRLYLRRIARFCAEQEEAEAQKRVEAKAQADGEQSAQNAAAKPTIPRSCEHCSLSNLRISSQCLENGGCTNNST
ncbi:uncharacterized protein F4822DRAFT_442048 [Hypoxylon trugodes]|uniref:uncharacterized protein n=1 Tax=Hypoxylon trugodes TaxID=326681 RepID=UPI002195D207|nr:uncharacterized protein F4822DRAFT_442048 [Hypoxylon trugodes]KAI1390784.1 hypothetical protein F4822DRAFT_442048 [Hypoxylon trugodes]